MLGRSRGTHPWRRRLHRLPAPAPPPPRPLAQRSPAFPAPPLRDVPGTTCAPARPPPAQDDNAADLKTRIISSLSSCDDAGSAKSSVCTCPAATCATKSPAIPQWKVPRLGWRHAAADALSRLALHPEKHSPRACRCPPVRGTCPDWPTTSCPPAHSPARRWLRGP